MKKLMFIFGTRPEFIKIYPIIIEAKKQGNDVVIVNTGQHKEMSNQLIDYFNFKVDYDLKIMDKVDGLSQIISKSMLGLDLIVKKAIPDLILVHRDTAAIISGAMVAFYNKVKLGHIEAGLRTNIKYSPFPEEINRQMVGVIADYHFAPTHITRENLLLEGKKKGDLCCWK